MEKILVAVGVNLYTHECPVCGVIYGLSEQFDGERSSNGGSWYCPNGHNLSYTESEAAKLRDKLNKTSRKLELTEARLESAWNERDAACRSANAYKGHNTRLKNRVQAGLCTECHRHFENLQRHMETKHPKSQ